MNKAQKTLFVVLAIVGVLLTLHINGALAAESTKPLKCTYPENVVGAFGADGQNGMFILGAPAAITVLEKKTLTGQDEEGKKITIDVYRFDATYDQPEPIFYICPMHGPEGPYPYEMYSQILPPEALKNFLLPVESATECK